MVRCLIDHAAKRVIFCYKELPSATTGYQPGLELLIRSETGLAAWVAEREAAGYDVAPVSNFIASKEAAALVAQ